MSDFPSSYDVAGYQLDGYDVSGYALTIPATTDAGGTGQTVSYDLAGYQLDGYDLAGFGLTTVNDPTAPAQGAVLSHPAYELALLCALAWNVDQYQPIRAAIYRRDLKLSDVPDWAQLKITAPDGTATYQNCDFEPNDPTGTLCLPAQVQKVGALMQFPAPGRYTVEMRVQIGADHQRPASSIVIVVR